MTEAKTKTVTISGKEFEVRQPFATGHVLTEGEAQQLNQTRAENVRNNLAAKVKLAFGDEPSAEVNPETIASIVADYDNAYEMTLATVGAKRVTDPIEVEARKIAVEMLTDFLKKKGLSYRKLNEDVRNAKVAEISALDKVIAMAKKRVAERTKRAEDALGDVDLSGLQEEAPAGETTEQPAQ